MPMSVHCTCDLLTAAVMHSRRCPYHLHGHLKLDISKWKQGANICEMIYEVSYGDTVHVSLKEDCMKSVTLPSIK